MKDIKRPLIAFCIPTFNRSSYLKESLETYVNNKDFDEEIEIVISDNASIDDTQSVGLYYASKYKNIHYFRNEENVADSNFSLALDRATAYYVKLANDNLPLAPNGIKYIKEKVKKYLFTKEAIFFVEGYVYNCRLEDEIICSEFEDLILKMSRNVTWIALFGAWKEQWMLVKNRNKYSGHKLGQVDWFYQIMALSRKAVLLTQKCYLKKKQLTQKGGYNWFQIQIDNYYSIMQPYIDKGLVSKNVIRKEKITCIKEIMPWIAKAYWLPIYPNWKFDFSGTTYVLWKNFKKIPFFYFIMATIPIWANWYVVKYYTKSLLSR